MIIHIPDTQVLSLDFEVAGLSCLSDILPDFFTASEQRGRQRNGPSADNCILFNCTATSRAHDDKQQETQFRQGHCLG